MQECQDAIQGSQAAQRSRRAEDNRQSPYARRAVPGQVSEVKHDRINQDHKKDQGVSLPDQAREANRTCRRDDKILEAWNVLRPDASDPDCIDPSSQAEDKDRRQFVPVDQ